MKYSSTFIILFLMITLNSFAQQKWHKGNTHSHTTFSDGDTPVKEVVQWYHDHGYNFLSITDHNKTIFPGEHINLDGFRDDFILIIGNEITSSVHFTALGVNNNFNVKSIVEDFKEGKLKGYELPEPDSTKVGHSQVLINGMLDEGALVFINHPNFSTGISGEEMLKLKGAAAIELFNAHPTVYNFGNDLHIPVEEKWDYLLSNGMHIYGVGADDEHHLQKWGPDAANPGRSWIMVEAEELNEEKILDALKAGDFYASTGVELSLYEAGDNLISVEIDKKKTLKTLRSGLGIGRIAEEGMKGFRIDVIGRGGEIIHSVNAERLDYPFDKIDNYIRIRATYCKKHKGNYETYYAWMQPVFAN